MLIEQGQQASQAGDHALALQRAEQAMAIQVTPSLRLFYARELVVATRPADAFSQAEACVREAERDASVPNREALMEGCRAIAQETRASLGMLTVNIGGARPQALTVTVSGRPLAEALIGVPSAVNPGRVVVEASARGFHTVRREVEVGRGASESVTLDMVVDPHVPVGSGAQGLGDDDDNGPARTQFRTRPLSIGAVVVTAAGGVVLASAGLFFALRQGGFGSCVVMGDTVSCPDAPQAEQLRTRADNIELMNTLTNVALIGGTVILAGGVAWLAADRATAREQVTVSRRRTLPRFALAADARTVGVVVGGAW
jgi:hypothetical protein